MKNLWNSREGSKTKDRLDLLVYRSRLIGSEPKLCVWGGGNTSTKWIEKDHLGRKRLVLRVKGSGSDLKASTRNDFPPVALEDLQHLLKRTQMTDEAMVDYVRYCVLEPKAPRPSIEVLLHAFVDQPDIDHTHADAILSLTNTRNGKQIAWRIFRDELIWVPYVKPGFTLAKWMYEAYCKRPHAKGAILERHGLITWGQNAQTSYSRTIEMVSRAERYIEASRRRAKYWNVPSCQKRPTKRLQDWLVRYLPTIRQVVSERQTKILVYDGSPEVLEFVNARDVHRISQQGPATPDHMLRTKRVPLYLNIGSDRSNGLPENSLRKQINEYAARHKRYFMRYRHLLPRGFATMLDPYPRVILIPGVGMVTTGNDMKSAKIVAEIYRHSISVMKNATLIDTYKSLSEKLAFEIEYWPLELYKLSLAPPEAEFSGRVALVTGAARGIGRAIAEKLAKESAHVFVSDIDSKSVRRAAASINVTLGRERAFPLVMDVTNPDNVEKGFQDIVRMCGGIDFVVSNAGIAHVASIEKMALVDWERSLAVNATGHFLVAREAVKLLQRQKMGGALVFIASKNVLAPGKDFGAYSAAKAAETQLARILAIENGADGIRANLINPDGIFEDSGLWERIGRDRAQSYGIARNRLEGFYQGRNLMKTAILPEDVAEAVAFFVSSKSSKTTGCILTVDGGVKEAFPR